MKTRALLLIFVSLIFVTNNFSQTLSQTDAFNKFWDLAVKNDFESAKAQLEPTVLTKEKIEKIKQNFQIVSANGLKMLDFRLINISLNQAFFTVTTKDKNGQEGLFQMTMTKIKDDWKISAFNYEVVVAVTVNGDASVLELSNTTNQPFGKYQNSNKAQILPLRPYNPKENPVEFLAEPYNPNKNPVQYQNIVPKPK